MHVGVMKIYLRLEDNQSLKGKRRLIRPVLNQIQNRFNVSVAEIEEQNIWDSAVIGVSMVSSDVRLVHEIISHITDFVNSGRFSVEVTETQIEVIPV